MGYPPPEVATTPQPPQPSEAAQEPGELPEASAPAGGASLEAEVKGASTRDMDSTTRGLGGSTCTSCGEENLLAIEHDPHYREE